MFYLSNHLLLHSILFLISFIGIAPTFFVRAANLPESEKIFHLSLLSEPHSADPAKLKGSSGSYLFNNVYRSLYTFDNKKLLVPEAAKYCKWSSSLKLICVLKRLKFSDGSAIEAKHYVKSFTRLMNPKTKSLKIRYLIDLKNARKILKGLKKPSSLGIKAITKYKLSFEFDKPSPEFLYYLISPILSPIKNEFFLKQGDVSKIVTSGPYKFKSWVKGKYIILEPNLFYKTASKVISKRPFVKFHFIESEDVALRMYELKKLNLLRRVPTVQVTKLKDKKDFFRVPVARFDYIGFGKGLESQVFLRKAMVHALNYRDLQKLYGALGRPGCPSLPRFFLDSLPCYDFNLKKARKYLSQVSKEAREKRWKLVYSKSGGEDIRRGMEWLAYQWKKNLGLNIEISPTERGMLVQTIKFQSPDIFRKGVALDRPTCKAALETFTKESLENYINYDNKLFAKKIVELSLKTKTNTEKKKLCSQAIKILLKSYKLIPLGEIHFSLMNDNKFLGFKFNSLNQLDLTDLRFHESVKK